MNSEERIKKFFCENIKGKDIDQIDPNIWEYYSDWHKEVFGFRPDMDVNLIHENEISYLEKMPNGQQ